MYFEEASEKNGQKNVSRCNIEEYYAHPLADLQNGLLLADYSTKPLNCAKLLAKRLINLTAAQCR